LGIGHTGTDQGVQCDDPTDTNVPTTSP
jgi:hypothetical protein